MENKSILIFGAGKIGRSFIGRLFSEAGYDVVFVDINKTIVNTLNKRKSYKIIIKGEKEEQVVVHNIRAIYAHDQSQVVDQISIASILAVSVGKNSLKEVIPVIGKGLLKRSQINKKSTLDIILAENMRSAAQYTRDQLSIYLPNDYPINQYPGLVETSIGKMVPLLTPADLLEDPLQVFAEPYNELILDKDGFTGEIPIVKDLWPKENIKAWVDRKAFIHNMGHTAVAFLGNFHHPSDQYIHDALEDDAIYAFAKKAMLQAVEILLEYYPNDFRYKELESHTDDLLTRFQNRALKDTIFRVGQDLPRKLNVDDRFVAIIKMAKKKGLSYNLILESMVYGFFFKSTDENGNPAKTDEMFHKLLSHDFEGALVSYCGFNRINEQYLIEELKEQYLKLVQIKEQKEIQL